MCKYNFSVEDPDQVTDDGIISTSESGTAPSPGENLFFFEQVNISLNQLSSSNHFTDVQCVHVAK